MFLVLRLRLLIISELKNSKGEIKDSPAVLIALGLTKHSARCTRHHMLSVVQLANIFSNIRSSDTSMTLHTHVITQSQHNLPRPHRCVSSAHPIRVITPFLPSVSEKQVLSLGKGPAFVSLEVEYRLFGAWKWRMWQSFQSLTELYGQCKGIDIDNV